MQHSPINPCCSHGQEEPTFNQTIDINTGKRNLVCRMSRLPQYLQKTWGRVVPLLATPKSLLQTISKVLGSAATPDISQGIPCTFITYSTETLHIWIPYWSCLWTASCSLAPLIYWDSPTAAWAALWSCGCTEQEWFLCICILSEMDRFLTCCLSQGSNMGCSPQGPNFRLFIK